MVYKLYLNIDIYKRKKEMEGRKEGTNERRKEKEIYWSTYLKRKGVDQGNQISRAS